MSKDRMVRLLFISLRHTAKLSFGGIPQAEYKNVSIWYGIGRYAGNIGSLFEDL
jgi:hypothetical protein